MSWEGDAAPNTQLAGWWLRVGATVIDGLLVGLPVGLIGVATGSRVALSLLILVAQLAYASILLSRRGQTVGMQAVGTRCALEATGTNLSPQQALARTAVASASTIVSVVSPTLGLVAGLFSLADILWPLWDAKNQTIHDKVVGSLVLVHTKQIAAPPFPPSPQSGTWGQAGGWQGAPTAQPTDPGRWQSAPAYPAPGPAAQSAPPAEPAPPAQSIPAAWYADPAGSDQDRWWDGKSWTEHLRARP